MPISSVPDLFPDLPLTPLWSPADSLLSSYPFIAWAVALAGSSNWTTGLAFCLLWLHFLNVLNPSSGYTAGAALVWSGPDCCGQFSGQMCLACQERSKHFLPPDWLCLRAMDGGCFVCATPSVKMSFPAPYSRITIQESAYLLLFSCVPSLPP